MPHLGSLTVRSRLWSWEASWGPGVSGSCFTWAWGNLVGVACCPLPAGEGREDGIRGAQVSSGFPQAQSLVASPPTPRSFTPKGRAVCGNGGGGRTSCWEGSVRNRRGGWTSCWSAFFLLMRSLATCTPVWQFFK